MPASHVALIRCESYDLAAVSDAVARGLELLGGAERFVRPGERIVLKPNLLVGSRPEEAVTTHPAVFEAVIDALREAGAELSYGDSPGIGGGENAARKSGLTEVAERLGVPGADFSAGRVVSFPAGHFIKQFTLANGALDADGLVSLSKLKAHGLTRITGAIKNQFGCIPGALKGEFHARMPDADRFAQMLVDLTRCVAPRLYVMDGILAMEGNGPRSGDPRMMNVLIFSDDPVAIDATVCRLVDLDPTLVLSIRCGAERGLGTATDIEYLGDALETFVAPDFKVNRSPGSTTGSQGAALRLLKNLVVPRPVIDPAKCTACGTCVKVCPVDPKAVNFPANAEKGTPPEHDYGLCIRCYCCQELCPERAISVKTPPLGRLIHRT